MRLRLLLGSFSMRDLAIGNAPGFEAKRFLSLGRTETSISYAALGRRQVVLEKLVLSDLVINLEWQGGKANYSAILEGMSGGSADDSSSTTFIIDELLIQNVTARLHLKGRLGNIGAQEVHVPEIRLTGVGRRSGGEQISGMTREIVSQLLLAVLRQSKLAVPQLALEIAPALRELRGLAGATSQKTGDLLEELGEAAGGLLERFGRAEKD